MKHLHYAIFIIALFSACQPTIEKPNILFMMVDDLGKEWVSCYGAEDIQTPFIDRLAREGIRFDNVYCMPQCTPTRVTLLTGQYPFRHGWINHWDVPRWGGGVHFDETMNPSLARYLKEAGYKTAVAGKWQINDFRVEPDALTRHGFDTYCMWTGYEMGVDASVNRYWDAYTYEVDGNKTYSGQFGPDVFNDFVIDFIIENQDTAWFVYYPMVLTHGPLVNPPGEIHQTKLDKHKAMVSYTDKLTGQIISALESTGQRKRTLFIWSTDNGTSSGISGHLQGESVRGGKASTGENGICVPFIVSAPGLIREGINTDVLVDFTDLLPTFLDLANHPLPDNHVIDGQSFKKFLLDHQPDGNRNWILGMGGGNNANLTANGMENQYFYRDRVIRNKQFKLYISSERKAEAFYDLSDDPFEKNNLLVTQLTSNEKKNFDDLFAAVQQFPITDNEPSYQPTPPQAWDRAIKPSAKRLK